MIFSEEDKSKSSFAGTLSDIDDDPKDDSSDSSEVVTICCVEDLKVVCIDKVGGYSAICFGSSVSSLGMGCN